MCMHIMTSTIQPLLDQIKAARQRKGLSQRALGERVGLPQSHISKIEKGTVDLQASSLIELARAVDLELVLLPRTSLPAIRAIQESDIGVTDRTTAPRPAYRLDDGDDDD
jgi:HTH-type transcriptional regulator / antitoxin HipB